MTENSNHLKLVGNQRFPDWTALYEEQAMESLPWFHPELDPDLAATLADLEIRQGSFLDLGTGPGTQALCLANMGFQVVGSDIAQTAIDKLKTTPGPVEFVRDDILRTRLRRKFDYIFDRGCFHVLQPESRARYVDNVRKLMQPQGLYFLKCFSTEQEVWERGPWRFSPADIKRIFDGAFVVESATATSYQGTLTPQPKALFVVMRPAP